MTPNTKYVSGEGASCVQAHWHRYRVMKHKKKYCTIDKFSGHAQSDAWSSKLHTSIASI